jgi:hypothetical protein
VRGKKKERNRNRDDRTYTRSRASHVPLASSMAAGQWRNRRRCPRDLRGTGEECGLGVVCAALRCVARKQIRKPVVCSMRWSGDRSRGAGLVAVASVGPATRRRCGAGGGPWTSARLLTAVGRSVVCVLDPPRSRAHRGSFARSTLRVYPCIRFSVWSFDGSDKLERCDHLLHCMLIQSVCTIEIRSYTIRASHLTTSRASLD